MQFGHELVVTEFIASAQQLLNQLRSHKPITSAEEQMIESLMFMLRLELDERKLRPKVQQGDPVKAPR